MDFILNDIFVSFFLHLYVDIMCPFGQACVSNIIMNRTSGLSVKLLRVSDTLESII